MIWHCIEIVFERRSLKDCAITILGVLIPFVEPRDISTRLFKARKAKTNEYPFVTWIERDGELSCTGSHVADEWLLTSAQCVTDVSDLSTIRVVLGDTLVRNQNDGQLYFGINQIEIAPGYNATNSQNDVALLRITEAVNTSPRNLGLVSSLMTDPIDDIQDNKENCVVASFGDTDVNVTATRKMKLSIRVAKDRDCNTVENYNSSNMICFKPRRGKGTTCQGDQGAPIICPVNGTDTVVGINTDGDCSNALMLASKVSEYIGWYNNIIDTYSYQRCTSFPVVLNGTYTADGPAVANSTAQLKCDSDTTRTSTNITITCLSNGNYSEPLALCGCGRFPSVTGGDFETNGTNAINEEAVLACDEGYIANTTDLAALTITCQNTGSWTEVNAFCIQECGEPDPVANGTYEGTPPYIADSTAILRCDPLFTRSERNDNKALITCRSNGKWTAQKAVCERTCDALSLPDNGVYTSSENVPVEGDTAVLTCNGGYIRNVTDDADATITCDSNGVWDTTSAACFKECDSLPTTNNGSFANTSVTPIEGDSAVLQCDRGYLRSVMNDSDATITCDTTGAWDSTAAVCNKVCDALPSSNNGSFANTSVTPIEGDSAVLQCDGGYLRSVMNDSDATITCDTTGAWDSTDAVCNKVCDALPSPNNGSFANTSVTPIEGDSAVLQCDGGYLRSVTNDSDASITCDTIGAWDSTAAVCNKVCEALPSSNNGSFANTSVTPIEGDTAVLQCDGGYLRSVTNDSDATISCDFTGAWDSTAAVCNKLCDALPTFSNGSFANTSVTPIEGDSAVLQCDGGFLRSVMNDSDATITCDTTGAWDSTAAVCNKVCDALPAFNNGSFANTSVTPIEGDTAILQCDAGYLRSVMNDSDATITCDTTGAWDSTVAVCNKVCDALPAFNNGSFANTSVTPIEGDTAILQCDAVYLRSVMNDSDATISCDNTGAWNSTAAVCNKVCDALPSSNNGSFANTSVTPIEGDSAVLQCDGGYLRSVTNDSDATITCDTIGAWDSTAAVCNKICDALPSSNNGSFANTSVTPIEGDSAVLQCDGGYLRSVTNDSDATITCSTIGTWDSTAAVCNKICDALPSSNNGSFANTSVTPIEGDSAVLQCDGGYLRSVTNDSEATITCDTTGAWDSTAAVCNKVCDALPSINNGSFANTSITPIEGDSAVLQCDVGYLRSVMNNSDATITCNSTGIWDSTAAICNKVCDALPMINNGSFANTSVTPIEGDSAVLQCDGGYLRSVTNDSEATITCDSTGAWSSTAAICERTCGSATLISNGTFTVAGGLLVNDTAVLRCDAGFTRTTTNDSEATIVCQEDGQWSNSSAFCSLGCGDPIVVVNGNFTVNGTSIGDEGVLLCESGYAATSDSVLTITCGIAGSWTTINTTCEKSCEVPPNSNNATYDMGTYFVNDTIVLKCDSGFQRSTSNDSEATRTCSESGNWTVTDAYCIKLCYSPPSIANGTFNVTSQSLLDDVAILTCDSGYVRSITNDSEASITCLGTGNWSTTSAYCIRSCGATPEVSYGVFGSNTTTYIVNDTAELVCNSGYTRSTAFVAEASLTCQDDGNWDTSTAFCVESCSSTGTSFMVSFFKNIDDTGSAFLYGSVYEATDITLNIPKYSYSNTLSLTKYISATLSDDLAAFGNSINDVAIEVTSTKPINLYIHHARARSYEGTAIYPENCANKDYIVAAHDSSFVAPSIAGSESVIVALEDSTTVTINEQPSGSTKTETINRFDVLNVAAEDLSGTIITADKNIQVFAGHRCANIPDRDTGRCDYIIEQMPPIASLRRAYLLTYQDPRPHFSVRVVAPYDNTEITFADVNGTTIKTVQMNISDTHFESFYDSDTISITSTKDILVAQYAHGKDSDDSDFGDPSYVVMSSVTQFINDYIIMIDTNLYSRHYVAIFIRDDDDISGLRVNNENLTTDAYTTAHVPGVGKYKLLHERIDPPSDGTQPIPVTHIDSNVNFGVMQYGFSANLGFALMAGRNIPDYTDSSVVSIQ